MVERFSALIIGRTLLPRNNCLFLVIISSSPVLLERLVKFKKCSHFIGSRTGDLAACGIVPQPLRYCVPPTCSARVEFEYSWHFNVTKLVLCVRRNCSLIQTLCTEIRSYSVLRTIVMKLINLSWNLTRLTFVSVHSYLHWLTSSYIRMKF
jgi:hypothetical protein